MASGNASGCTVRTDNRGRAYVLWTQFAFGFPGFGATVLILWLMIAKPF
jgi:uncharacterized membrane protein